MRHRLHASIAAVVVMLIGSASLAQQSAWFGAPLPKGLGDPHRAKY